MKLANSRFDLLFEDNYSRFQSGGLVGGDVVKFRANAKNHPFLKDAEPGFRQMVQELMDSDLNLKVGAVKIVRPGRQYDTSNSIYGYTVDVIQEYAPGLFKTPVTVPIEILERVEGTGQGRNPQPVPNSLKRKERGDGKPEKTAPFKWKVNKPLGPEAGSTI